MVTSSCHIDGVRLKIVLMLLILMYKGDETNGKVGRQISIVNNKSNFFLTKFDIKFIMI